MNYPPKAGSYFSPVGGSKNKSIVRSSAGATLNVWRQKNQLHSNQTILQSQFQYTNNKRGSLEPLNPVEESHLPSLDQYQHVHDSDNFRKNDFNYSKVTSNVQQPLSSPTNFPAPTFASLDIFNAEFETTNERPCGRPTTSQLRKRPKYSQQDISSYQSEFERPCARPGVSNYRPECNRNDSCPDYF